MSKTKFKAFKSHKEARKKLSEDEEMEIVNWYCGCINHIEDIPIEEINYYLEEVK